MYKASAAFPACTSAAGIEKDAILTALPPQHFSVGPNDALFADFLSRPEGPASGMLRERMPRARRSLELLLGGRKELDEQELTTSTMIELFLGPVFFHALFTPRVWPKERAEQLSEEGLAELFARTFVRARAARRP